ncbi:MAG: 16S rRNA endonuclease CdiA [Candidatus Erwinia impunctatus]|nr:16S rRNA endonuclease CdiA [Culicoides impunctatus]
MDVGRDLMLTSQQDTDNYDSKQTSISAGGSASMGGGSASLSLSKDKMHSTYASVQEQTGIFPGKGGFDITVGGHTQLNGAVIGSTATADNNRLDTGTLGFSNITNQAEYKVEHQSAGIGTSGSIGSQFLGNAANNLLIGAANEGSASSTTYSAMSEGSLVVRDTVNQQQDICTLSRDVEHANQTLSPIFDKEKEQNRLKEAQLIGEIGSQAADIARTQGDISGLSEAKKVHPGLSAEELRNTDVYKTEMAKYGTGSAIQQGIQAAKAAVQGLAGGDIGKALAGGASPYLAEVIHRQTTNADGTLNKEANLMAHAVLGAALAAVQGNNALGGAAAGVTAEFVAQQMYPGIPVDRLTEEQKQTISTLSTLAAGLAGGLIGDSTADTVGAAQIGKNAVENNYLSVSEKTELELAKQTLRNSKDPLEREKAQQKYDALLEKDISSDKAVIAACANGQAASAACASERLKVIEAKEGYEGLGNYNSKASQQYADAYGHIVNLLNITSVDAQNQQQVKDAMVNYAMAQLGIDKDKATAYIETYDGMKVIAASISPVLGTTAANKLGAMLKEANSSNAALSISERVKENIAASQQARESSNFGVHIAKSDQLQWGYKADEWTMVTLPAGSKVYGGIPGQSSYYTSLDTLLNAEFSRESIFKSLQVSPHPEFGYRPQMGIYEVINDIKIPSGKVMANPLLGPGEADQYFIKNYNNQLKLIDKIDLGE